EDAQRFLAEASRQLAESFDYEATLRRVAQIATRGFADGCVIDLVDEQGHRERVAVEHFSRKKEELALETWKESAKRESLDPCVQRVVQCGQSQLIVDDTRDEETQAG